MEMGGLSKKVHKMEFNKNNYNRKLVEDIIDFRDEDLPNVIKSSESIDDKPIPPERKRNKKYLAK